MKPLKIHYTAPDWHGGYPKFFRTALRSLGHEVFYFNDYGNARQRFLKKMLARIPRAEYRSFDYFRKEISAEWLASVRAFKPDLVILGHAPSILPEDIREVKKDGIKVFYWMDAPPAGAQAKDAIAGAIESDLVFSVDRTWMTILYAPEDFIHLPIAGDPATFFPIAGVTESSKEYDVLWLGSMPPQTGDGYLRAKMVSEIPDKYRVVVCGNGTEYWTKQFPNLKKRIEAGSILGFEKMNDIYNKTKIVLNIHSTSNLTALSGRTFEIGLSGAFQLSDWRADMETDFPGDDMVTFRYAKELNPLIAKWIDKPEERAAHAAKVRERVLLHHTWQHRAQAMLKHFEG